MFGIGTTPLTSLQLIRKAISAGQDADGNPMFTGELVFPNALLRDDGTPSQDGDVISCQPNGTFQARPSGARGAYEVYTVTGGMIGFNPVRGVGYPFAYPTVPNNG